ncbi:hypothetical protein L2E82_19470 [Cichorium intybus]|uniref:Uncharacterized protein n=1 Tax=Cichorium intybus TaxID=13427 RepID=A0ACB9FCN7_CICIN|nr:hypothetical protein L2E82_19470 [Cichorium intybus]
MFSRAYNRNDYSLAVLGLLVLLSLALYDCCLPLYVSIPENEKSSRKFLLKLIIWCLYTALSIGFVYEFGYFLSFQITVALYAVVLVCSVFLLYKFVIVELVNDWKSRNSGEDAIGILENQRLDAGELKDSDSVMEKV